MKLLTSIIKSIIELYIAVFTLECLEKAVYNYDS